MLRFVLKNYLKNQIIELIDTNNKCIKIVYQKLFIECHLLKVVYQKLCIKNYLSKITY